MTPQDRSIVKTACPNPSCRKPISVSGESDGQPRKCPHCNTPFLLARNPQASATNAGRASGTVENAPPPLPVPKASGKAELPEMIGPYKISRELGRGAFGVVYRGLDSALNRDVAIKVLNRTALASQKAVDRFRREAQVVAGMHHGHIVPVYQFGEYEGGYYIASRFIPGKSLTDAIPDNGLPATQAVKWTIQLLEALAYAHSLGVMHRDVKPDNALLDEKEQLFLTDFGLAGWVGQAEMTQDGSVMGTPVYMSPEQARGSTRDVAEPADQYSAGVVFYELLTGHRPFESGNVQVILHNVIHTDPPPPSEWRTDLDAELELICMTALAKQPARRFPSCAAMAQALRVWQERTGPQDALSVVQNAPRRPRSPTAGHQTQGPATSRRTQVAERPPPTQIQIEPEPAPASRPWLLLGLVGALVLVVLVVVSGVVIYSLNQEKKPTNRPGIIITDPNKKKPASP